jgi:hypothetical protein
MLPGIPVTLDNRAVHITGRVPPPSAAHEQGGLVNLAFCRAGLSKAGVRSQAEITSSITSAPLESSPPITPPLFSTATGHLDHLRYRALLFVFTYLPLSSLLPFCLIIFVYGSRGVC